MNEIYTFTGELVNDHLERHTTNENNLPLRPEVYCPICYPPPEEYTLPFLRFWYWIETAGALSYNLITQQTFNELVGYDYGEAHPTII